MAHQADPADAAARYHYAELSYEAGHFGDALDLLESLLAADDPDVEVLLLGARIEYLFGRYDRAEELLHRVLEREPDNTPAAAKLVFIYYQTNRYSLCEALPGEALEGMRLPHLDLMLAFEDVPYQAVWRDGDETVVPFLVTDPLPVIEVEVNGRKVTVLIDTGGDAFILDPSIASELGIEIVASMMGMFAGGMEAEVGFARAKSLALGGVTLHSVPISVLPTGGMAIGGHTLEGIVGTGVLKQFLATLDYPNEELVLRAPSGRAASAFRAGAAGKVLDEVPFYLQSTHFLLARGSLNGVDDLLFQVDSGLAGTPAFSAPRQTLEYVGIPIPEIETREGNIGGGGAFATGTFEIAELGLGELVQSDLVGDFGALPPQGYRMLGFIQDGLISHNFLKAYAWTLDFERMRMVFTR
ncbi:MAG: aspartyl protease family protein, partial [Candidatus Eisenbacteria sp.]|nr:aspartyl protease family protein [Candidatus Eisenbacteria bacterium]